MIDKLLDILMHSGCYIKDTFHIYCPGCGGTRALKELLKLNIAGSLAMNPMVIVVFLVIAFMHIREKRLGLKKNNMARIVILTALLVFWFGYFLFRNYLLLYKGIDLLGDFSC